MIMADTYEGWSNRQTWHIALLIDNDRWTYDYWQQRAQFCKDDCLTEASMVETLAEMLEADYQEQIEDARTSLPDFAMQLLSDAMEQVDFREIAEHLLAD
jgi:hypothetical protein